MKAFMLMAVLALSLASNAADFPELVMPAGVGVNIHFTRGHEKDLDMIAAAGFKFIRMDFSWGGTERKPQEYDWSAYDELTANLEKRGLQAIYILDYSNGNYEETVTSRNPISGELHRDVASPQRPESVAAFARWAGQAAAHFKGRRIVWEVWNEPNIGFWKPKPDAKQYAQLLLATCKAVRAADPQATIVAPASSEFPWGFFEDIFKAGALEHLDGVSVHPYRNYSKGPETAAEDYQKLRALIARYAPPGKRNLPIVSGEWGYATHTEGGVSLETQAAFIARQQIANLWQGIPISIWYDWKNDGPDAAEREHNFGTVTHDLSPKPSYRAVQTLTRELSGYRIVRRIETTDRSHYVFLLVNSAGEHKLVAWTDGSLADARIDLGADQSIAVSAVDGTGKEQAAEFSQGRLQLRLNQAPQYISLGNRSTILSAMAAWNAQLLTPLVEAGKAKDLRLSIQVTNPFSGKIQAEFRLQLPDESDVASLKTTLEPGESRTLPLNATVLRRAPQQRDIRLVMELFRKGKNGSNQALHGGAEQFHFAISNPLELGIAPSQAGLRLSVSSQNHTPFAGEVKWAGKTRPVQLSLQNAEQILLLGHPNSTAANKSLELRDKKGTVVASIPVPRFQPLSLKGLQAALDGDSKVPASATLVSTNSPDGTDAPFDQAFKLNYDFDEGWRFVRCPPTTPLPVFEGKPAALGLWVFGDNSGNVLRARVTDSSGQTFQPDGFSLNWTGWRWIAIDLSDLSHAGHWGGANDGIVHGQLRLDCPLLLDGTRRKTSGTIYFTGVTVVYP